MWAGGSKGNHSVGHAKSSLVISYQLLGFRPLQFVSNLTFVQVRVGTNVVGIGTKQFRELIHLCKKKGWAHPHVRGNLEGSPKIPHLILLLCYVGAFSTHILLSTFEGVRVRLQTREIDHFAPKYCGMVPNLCWGDIRSKMQGNVRSNV